MNLSLVDGEVNALENFLLRFGNHGRKVFDLEEELLLGEIGLPWLMQVVSNDFLETNVSFRDVCGTPITRVVGEGVATTCYSQFM